MSVINTRGFYRFWPVSWTITHIFGVLKRFPWMSNPKVRLRIGHRQSQLRPILARFLDYNSVLGSCSDFHDRRTLVCLCVGHQHLQFWPILARFMDYPTNTGVFMCRSSTFAVLADFGPLHGLLLTFLGSQSDFHD